ncbi:unnamed protein product [Closterium sp. NIES-64]|nr:unnamed protein product [Closterium sp. NIES-64]
MKALDVCCWCRCLSDRLSLSFPHSLLIPSHSFSSPSHSLLISFSFPSHSLLIPFSSPFHSLLIPFSFPFYSLLIPCSSPSHSLLIPFSFPSHSLLIPFSFILIPFSSPSHPLLIPFSFPYHPLLIPFSFLFLLIPFSFPSHSFSFLLILLLSFSFPSHSLPFSFPSHSLRIPFSSPSQSPSHSLLIPFSPASRSPLLPLAQPAPWFTMLVAAWVLCGLGVAAWLFYSNHSQYEDCPTKLNQFSLSLFPLSGFPSRSRPTHPAQRPGSQCWWRRGCCVGWAWQHGCSTGSTRMLVAAWVLCGLAVAAWLLYWKHSQYEDHREEALGVWCKERALMLQQLVLTHVGQMQADAAQTLTGIISVMGKAGAERQVGAGQVFERQLVEAYLTRTAYARPGNTGASSCVFVTDEER